MKAESPFYNLGQLFPAAHVAEVHTGIDLSPHPVGGVMARNWKEILLGRKFAPAPTTTRPDQPSNWEVIAGQHRRTGRNLSDWLAVMRGRPRAAVLVCPEGTLCLKEARRAPMATTSGERLV